MRPARLLTMVLALTLFWASVSVAKPLVLARYGKSNAVILIPQDPQRMELMAANDLSLYIRKMTGAHIPVVSLHEPQSADALNVLHGPIISVGATQLASQIRQREDWPRLEHREAYRARRAGRVIVFQGNYYSEAKADGAAWAVYTFLDHLGVRWFMPGDLAERYPKLKSLLIKELDLSGAPSMDYRAAFNFGPHTDWARRNRMGGINLETAHNFFHTPGSPFWPPDKWKSEYPEWFFQASDGGTPLCLSHPGGRARVIEKAVETFEKSPQTYSYSLTPHDAVYMPCPCERCKPLQDISQSDLMVDFWNAVSDGVAEKCPGKFCSALPYVNYLDPPKKVKVSKNFLPMLAPLGVPENSERFEKIVQGWTALAPRVYIYSYDMGMPARPRKVAQRFANYKRWGLDGVMVERRPAWAISGLNYWMEQRLMWDLDADPQALVDEFCNGLFGPQAGPVMKEFFYAVEDGASWDRREEIVNRAAKLLARRADSTEAQCVELFRQAEIILSSRGRMREAAKSGDFQAAADYAAQGIAAYHYFEPGPNELYYRDSGDAIGSYHREAVKMEPIYRAKAE